MLVANLPGTDRVTVATDQDTAANNAELDSFLVPTCYESHQPKGGGNSDIMKLVANKFPVIIRLL